MSLVIDAGLGLTVEKLKSEGMKTESGREGWSGCWKTEDVAMRFENSLWYHSESESASESTRWRLRLKTRGWMAALRGLNRGEGRAKPSSESEVDGVRGIPDE